MKMLNYGSILSAGSSNILVLRFCTVVYFNYLELQPSQDIFSIQRGRKNHRLLVATPQLRGQPIMGQRHSLIQAPAI